jgi:hypothetical protein
MDPDSSTMKKTWVGLGGRVDIESALEGVGLVCGFCFGLVCFGLAWFGLAFYCNFLY